jgi:ankyrin repeat protein
MAGKRVLKAVMLNHIKMVEECVNAGDDVNEKDSWGGYALLQAVIQNNTEIFNYLLKVGARPQGPDYFGCTLMQAAELNNNKEIMNALSRLPVDSETYTLPKRLTPLRGTDLEAPSRPAARHAVTTPPLVEPRKQAGIPHHPAYFATLTGHREADNTATKQNTSDDKVSHGPVAR